ncbi:MAG: acyl-ACP desaturase [Gammaproteobacteria bacterium]|jgi:hypothetical protein|nr:acyl-ACP desaturase [Gammaproteobacteria bacterium]
MLYPELFRTLEHARWRMDRDIPWGAFEADRLSDDQALTVKMNAITEWSALPATEMFLRDNRQDSDFSAFMSIWFYEEQKHSLVLMEYLRRFRPDLLPREDELHAVRFEFDPAPALETLMLHFCGEVRLTQWYRCAAEWHTEPVIREIYTTISSDEARHAGCYSRYMKKAIEERGDEARLAFAKIGVLMANVKTSRALHPTNLHVSRALYPGDTVQSRLPDPGWLERWLDDQIRFDRTWEDRVVTAILRKMANLLGVPLETNRDLQRYRKDLASRMAA